MIPNAFPFVAGFANPLPPPPPSPVPPNIDTRSSSGLVEVRIFAVAGLELALPPMMMEASPPPPFEDVSGEEGSGSSKSSRFSACWPCTTVLSAFSRAEISSSNLNRIEDCDGEH